VPGRSSILFVFCALLLGPIAGCSKGEKDAQAAKGPLVDYRAQLAPLAAIEKDALDAVTAHTGTRYTDDETLIAALKTTAIPKYRDYVAGLEKVKVDGEPIAAFHSRLIALAKKELAVLERLAGALERGDGSSVLFANQEHRTLAKDRETLLGELPTAAGRVEASAGSPGASGSPNR
jgi:hypothetical protein